MNNKLERTCNRCEKTFYAYPSHILGGRYKYCSDECRIPKIIIKCLICNKEFQTTKHKRINGRKYCSVDCRNKGHSEFYKSEKRTIKIGEGKYIAIHIWIKNHTVRPLLCELCNKDKKLYLANMTGVYNRDIINYKWLCAKCHVNEDRANPKRPDYKIVKYATLK